LNKSNLISNIMDMDPSQDRDELEQMDVDELKILRKELCEEQSDDPGMFPNGRDFDAEDEDGV